MSLMLSTGTDGYNSRRHLKRSETRPVLPRWRYVLELHLAGKKAKEIAELSGYSETTIYGILASEEMIAIKQQIMNFYDQEFENLFPDVVDAVRAGLASSIITERLAAATTWLKVHGKMNGETKQQINNYNLTAEDVVFNILNQRQADENIRKGS